MRRPHARLATALLLALGVAAAVALFSDTRQRALSLSAPSPRGADAAWRTATRLASPPRASMFETTVPAPGPDGVVRLAPTDRPPAQFPATGVPPGWLLKEFAGQATIETVRDGRLAVRLATERSSFALYRDVIVDPDELPLLSWWWKATRLPAGGDVRHRASDDQAVQLYVIFPRWPAPLSSSDVIGYVWDTTAPAGTRLISTRAGNVRVIVLESGRGGLGTWQRQTRNLVDDYVALFGRRPPRVGKIAFMIDSDDTGTEAEALIGEVTFRPALPEGKEIPTSMLR
ncbi:MAG TPA: DUF3047 domain-containing protein [Methylomirabilota bacterium]|jgi:hypothetical protein